MTNQNNSHSLHVISIVIACLALGTSIVFGVASCSHSRTANHISNDALALSKQSNETAHESNALSLEAIDLSRREHEVSASLRAPYINIRLLKNEIHLESVNDLTDSNFGIFVQNIDQCSIDMVRLQCYASMVFRNDELLHVESDHPGNHREIDVEFREVVRSRGAARADVKAQLLEQLLQLDLGSESFPEAEYRIVFNVTCAARIVGSSLPQRVGLNETIDTDRVVGYLEVDNKETITISWRPDLLTRDEIAEYAKKYQATPWVSNGAVFAP